MEHQQCDSQLLTGSGRVKVERGPQGGDVTFLFPVILWLTSSLEFTYSELVQGILN